MSKRSKKPNLKPAVPTAKSLRADGMVPIADQLSSYYSGIRGEYRKGLHHTLTCIYATALLLKQAEKARSEFCRDPHWADKTGPTPEQLEKEASHWMLIRVLGESQPARKRISKYGIVLRYFEGQACPPARLTERIKAEGGIEGVAKLAAKSRPGLKNPGAKKRKAAPKAIPGSGSTKLGPYDNDELEREKEGGSADAEPRGYGCKLVLAEGLEDELRTLAPANLKLIGSVKIQKGDLLLRIDSAKRKKKAR
jgi:hypothetical protein